MKEEKFKKELEYIKDERVKKSLIYMINKLPDYFFEVPASSTGKYHPPYAQNDGGLLRHTKAAVRIGYELLADACIGDKYKSIEKDLMLMALILHDGMKHGLTHERYVRFDHPLIMADVLEKEKDNLELNNEEIELVANCIRRHMGPYTTDYRGNEVLEKPKTKYENFVHMCDCLASKKILVIPFDENNEIID